MGSLLGTDWAFYGDRLLGLGLDELGFSFGGRATLVGYWTGMEWSRCIWLGNGWIRNGYRADPAVCAREWRAGGSTDWNTMNDTMNVKIVI